MALYSLTPSEPVVIDEDGLVNAGRVLVTANAAEARYQNLIADAERMDRIATGKENPTEADRMNLSFHLSWEGMRESYLEQAALWDTRRMAEAARRNYGRSQLVADTEATGVKLAKGYHRGSQGKGRF